MRLLHEFKDDIYPKDAIAFEKHAARAVALNQAGKVALLRCVNKEYGMDCYLTPGGGIESGETPEMAVQRELLEEIGFESAIQLTQRTDQEKKFIQRVEWKTIDAAIDLLETYPADPRGSTLQRRDGLALREAKKIMG